MKKSVIKPIFLIFIIGLVSWSGYTIYKTSTLDNSYEISVVGLTEITEVINIDDWSVTKTTYEWCTGAGTIENPYVIENLYINGHNLRNGIIINRTDEYFIIRNCTIFNCFYQGAAIWLIYANNGQILDNKLLNNQGGGIFLYYGCDNNTISNNIIFNNNRNGIYQNKGNNNEISSNSITDNIGRGIWVMNSNESRIIGNKLNNNWAGIEVTQITDSLISANSVAISKHGITLNYTDNVDVLDNSLQFNYNAILLNNSANSSISHNELMLNIFTFNECVNCSRNLIENNYVEDILNGFTSAIILLIIAMGIGIIFLKISKKDSKSNRHKDKIELKN